MKSLGRYVILLALLVGLSTDLRSQNAPQAVEAKSIELLEKADRALKSFDYKTARQAALELVESTTDTRVRLSAADTLLRCGDAETAVKLFDDYIKSRPQVKPYLWQRGIALYFVGDFKKGVEQFEVHRTVNPNDVENAAWHFLCVAKEQAPDQAEQLLLPAPNDQREPMDEVLEMFRTGETQAVKDRMNSFDEQSGVGKSARFYGHFYLGLYADALGELDKARDHLKQSADLAPANYMGDVAKVYAKYLVDQEG